VRHQVDLTRGIIDLKPPGRQQNKKVRPTIRLTITCAAGSSTGTSTNRSSASA
jgi:hypothetical protein